MSKFICIFGQKQNGKSTLAQSLIHNMGKQPRFVDPTKGTRHEPLTMYPPVLSMHGFADPVKQTLTNYFGVDSESMSTYKTLDIKHPKLDVSVRKALQTIGEQFRQIKSTVWIEKALDAPNANARNMLDGRVFADGRYLNEAAGSKARGGLNVFIYHPDRISGDPHPSESWVGHLARIVHNVICNYDYMNHVNMVDGLNEYCVKSYRVSNLFDMVICNNSTLTNLEKAVARITPWIREVYFGQANPHATRTPRPRDIVECPVSIASFHDKPKE